MISAFLKYFGFESVGVVDTGSGAIDLLSHFPGYALILLGRAVEGLGS